MSALHELGWLMCADVLGGEREPADAVKPTASTRYSGAQHADELAAVDLRHQHPPVLPEDVPESGGSGFRCRRWTDATALPSPGERSTAAVMAP